MTKINLNFRVDSILPIIDDCAPPQIKYSVKCGIFSVQLRLMVSSGGDSWTVAMVLGSARQIMESKVL